MILDENINKLKNLFSSNITLNDNDFKLVYNFMLNELNINENKFRFDMVRIRFIDLVQLTNKQFPNVNLEEINKISWLFAGIYSRPNYYNHKFLE